MEREQQQREEGATAHDGEERGEYLVPNVVWDTTRYVLDNEDGRRALLRSRSRSVNAALVAVLNTVGLFRLSPIHSQVCVLRKGQRASG